MNILPIKQDSLTPSAPTGVTAGIDSTIAKIAALPATPPTTSVTPASTRNLPPAGEIKTALSDNILSSIRKNDQHLRPKELWEKDGIFWKCVGKVVGTDGKNSFVFKLRANADKIKDPFPAGDCMQHEAKRYSDEKVAELEQKIAEAEKKRRPVSGLERVLNEIKCLKRLGCNYEERPDGVYMTRPDSEAINSRWKELQKSIKNLSDLDISSEENDQDSLSFAEAYENHDGYLGKNEFNHDWETHLRPVISEKLDVENYNPETRNLLKKNIGTFKTIIRNATNNYAELEKKLPAEIKKNLPAIINVIKTGVGVYADVSSAVSGHTKHWGEIILNQGMDEFIEHTSEGIGLWVPTYDLKGQNVTLEEVRVVWQAMRAMRK